MNIITSVEKFFKNFLPSPFSIAILLTLLTILFAYLAQSNESSNSILEIVQFWERGIWDKALMVFALQMMLMLVLGYSLALSKPIENFINYFLKFCGSNSRAALIITFLTILISLLNWGLGLIFGAIFVKKVGIYASKNNIKINYPFLGACGYSGLMVWHGGLSGSAPIKIAEKGHFLSDKIGVISLEETIFSDLNITVSILLIFIVPTLMYFLAKKIKVAEHVISVENKISENTNNKTLSEKIDNSFIFSKIIGTLLLIYLLIKHMYITNGSFIASINPNLINLWLLSFCIFSHKNLSSFIKSVNKAIISATGILIQFPLYFGIMGIMKYSGLINVLSDFFISISSENTFPIFTFLSAGLVNIFVPSGGGQWAVQGPIIVEAANYLNLSISKSVMALAYGDQITNMLQPFWALPLLGITKINAKDLLPYTLILLLIGSVIFITCLLIF